MTARQFTHKDATITVHRPRMADRLDSELNVAMLMNNVDRYNRHPFARKWHMPNPFAVMLVSTHA